MSGRLVAILSTLFSPASWRSYVARRQGRAFDRRFGTDTRIGVPESATVGGDPATLPGSGKFEPSAIPKFRRALAAVIRTMRSDLRQYSFVDFGSGKGLAVMLASQMPFRHVYGVERIAALHQVATSNVRRFIATGAACAPISLVCADALAFPWPEGDMVAYLYDSFDETSMSRLIEQLCGEVKRTTRSILVVYINPAHKLLFDGGQGFRTVFEDNTLCVYESLRSAVSGPP